jgi:class 3 adenylate cyclase
VSEQDVPHQPAEPGVECAACGAHNRAGRRFCLQCGAALAVTCPACGAANEPEARFCGDCGTALDPAGTAPAPAVPAARPETAPVSERRVVSALFADLVGFTTTAEHRDAEEVRELLSRYFDVARRIIERYGGIVEKFIGDAVMAVWGAPVAREDDAERAVRAGMDLVAAVTELGAGELRVRTGVVTGEAAVTLGVRGEGMVAGDVVNAAARVQATAEPGTTLVDDATRRASEAAIVYADAGMHSLKGRDQPVHLWRAERVVALAGGALRAAGLEPPFVGRDRELRVVKELFHGAAETGRARMVSVLGMAGIGKSRLVWEFEKYVDGLAQTVNWHQGGCPPYGEGVTYWPLAEMVRMRARMMDGDDAATARTKLQAMLARYVLAEDERRWLEPRLAELLGLEPPGSVRREELFAAWRRFFERVAEEAPAILVFENLQWADEGLLDFVEHLLDWSRSHPILVLALSRPELTARRANWGAGRPNVTALSLEPLRDDAMQELLAGLVPGLPAAAAARIGERAEGVPLYAVETVRMLLDRGTLRREGDSYALAAGVEDLDVPETLHALIAARLDGLDDAERHLLQDASVLGQMFSRAQLAAVTALPDDRLDALLQGLVRKEMLAPQADPLSPGRGQYGFLQGLVRKVAYDTLSRRDRKARHLAAARDLLATAADGDDPAEVVAAHQLAAYRAEPDAEDAPAIRAAACASLSRAGERAASLAAPAEAERHFVEAAKLAASALERAQLLERAGAAAMQDARTTEAHAHLEEAGQIFEREGRRRDRARVSARMGELMLFADQIEGAMERMEQSFAVLADEPPGPELGTLAEALARVYFSTGRMEAAGERIETALSVAESLGLTVLLADSLNTKHLLLLSAGRREEAIALVKHALELAGEASPVVALRCYNNLAYSMITADRHDEALRYAREGIALSEQLGERRYGWLLTTGTLYPLVLTGRWDEAVAIVDGMLVDDSLLTLFSSVEMVEIVPVLLARGEDARARQLMTRWEHLGASADLQERALAGIMAATMALGQRDHRSALARAEETLAESFELMPGNYIAREAFVLGLDAALALGDVARAESLLDRIEALDAAASSPYLRGQAERFRGRIAALGDDETAGAAFARAAMHLRDAGAVYALACTLTEQAEWLTARDRPEDAAQPAAEARAILERLGAVVWLARLDALTTPALAATPAASA